MARDLNAQQVQGFKDDVVQKNRCDARIDSRDGAYVNKVVAEDRRWKTGFWGLESNYEWLRSVKQKYGPDEVFFGGV